MNVRVVAKHGSTHRVSCLHLLPLSFVLPCHYGTRHFLGKESHQRSARKAESWRYQTMRLSRNNSLQDKVLQKLNQTALQQITIDLTQLTHCRSEKKIGREPNNAQEDELTRRYVFDCPFHKN